MRLQSPRGGTLTGTSSVTSPMDEHLRGTIQCRSDAQ